MNKSTCISCNGSGAKRSCPALGGLICGVCCGSKRNSAIACTPDCLNNPFGIHTYDDWLKLDGTWGDKCARYIGEHIPHDEYSFKSELSTYVLIEGSQDEVVISEAAPLYMHAKLFWEPFRDEKCLADYWEREGWKGLTNDERVMMGYRRKTYPAIVEIQDTINDYSSRCIDMLDPEAKPIVVYDRSMVRLYNRFGRSLNMLCRYPHYYRIGPSGVELQHELTEPFIEEMRGRAAEEGVTVRNYLLKHYVEACRFVHELARKRYEDMINSMDISEWKAVYTLNIPRDEIVKVLSMKPEFEAEESEEDDVLEYSWVRKGESKKIERKMPVFFRHRDENSGVGSLGRLKVHPDSLEIIAFGSQKFRFARKMIEKYLGSGITFRMETENNLKDELLKRRDEQREHDEYHDGGTEKDNEIPPEIRAEVLTKFHERHYRQFIDSPIPMLNGRTPRQAARDSTLRPKLIDLMKLHLHGIEKRNRMDPCLNLSIDWVVDELGLDELKRR